MATHNDTGKLGETLAQEYLVSQGFAIVATNWHRGKFEIDIIAYREGLIPGFSAVARPFFSRDAPRRWS